MKNGRVVGSDGGFRVWKDSELHCVDGPALQRENGNKEWFLNGQRHRVDGPAVERADGTKEWWQNGKLHREDGPAVEFANGDKEWWQNGKRHREDGPAVEYTNGYKEYWANGVRQMNQKFNIKGDEEFLSTAIERVANGEAEEIAKWCVNAKWMHYATRIVLGVSQQFDGKSQAAAFCDALKRFEMEELDKSG